ncbi:MAG: Stp1/IreP family PP2C-type Ser/Thr phosphatase [Spirochaetia bacterium]
MKITAYGQTHQGLVRSNNEDFFIINNQKSLFLLADGMGGHNAGEVASKEACRLFDKDFNPDSGDIKSHMREVFVKTNGLIYEQAAKIRDLEHMGATFIVCHIRESIAHILHAGDVRGYHFRSHKLKQVTADHSVVGELVKQGQLSQKEARQHPLKNRVTKAVGPRETIDPDYNKVELRADDMVLLCCDGLWNMVEDKNIGTVLKSEETIENKTGELINQALAGGGDDNITVLLIQTL